MDIVPEQYKHKRKYKHLRRYAIARQWLLDVGRRRIFQFMMIQVIVVTAQLLGGV